MVLSMVSAQYLERNRGNFSGNVIGDSANQRTDIFGTGRQWQHQHHGAVAVHDPVVTGYATCYVEQWSTDTRAGLGLGRASDWAVDTGWPCAL
jgi:hypothetical protein